MQNVLQLSVQTLEWAARRAGSTLFDFAHTLYVNDETVSSIVSGRVTVSQVRKISEHAKVPFGFLFLPTPPEDYKPNHELIDFRTVNNRQPLSEDFLEICKDVEHKQSWYRDYLISIDAPKLEFVGKYLEDNSVRNSVIAADIRKTLGLVNIAARLKNADEYYNAIAQSCEDNGILIFKNSIVVNSTRRRLNSEEFRGFVITDDYAPAIFINGDDSKYGNIFTLAHELAHIWLGESGISDVDVGSNNRNEIRCNAIAAEILVPQDVFLGLWDSTEAPYREKVSLLNRTFKVSELVIARIALTCGRITSDQYKRVHLEVMSRVLDKKNKDKGKNGSVPPAIMLPIRNSRRITKTVIDLVKSNRMSPSEASIILNASPATIVSL